MKTRVKIVLASLLLIIVYFFGDIIPGENGIESIHAIGNSYYSSKDKLICYILSLIPVILPLSIIATIFEVSIGRFWVIKILTTLMLCYSCFMLAMHGITDTGTEAGLGLIWLVIGNVVLTCYIFRIKNENIGESIL